MKKAGTLLYAILLIAVCVIGQDAYAASPYDDYYQNYSPQDADPATQTPPAAPADNDGNYTPPANEGYVDNDSYYSAPGTYYMPQSSGSTNAPDPD